MTVLDWFVLAAYLAGMIGFSVWIGRGQRDADDYYVGGRSLPWWAVGISTMATQSSAISFISIPAFVALKTGGGMKWLQYELAVPLAMIFVMTFLLPFFRKLELISVYEYMELRFGRGARLFLSGVFLVSRGFGTAVGVYATGIVLQTMLGLPLWAVLAIVGVVTVIYDTIGGMKAVVYSDVIQMGVLLVGIGAAIVCAASITGGVGTWFTSFPAERWTALEPTWGLGDGGKAPFWAYLIGGFFLYCSYYGTDQSQVQRELSTPSLDDTRRALLLNGLVRFPLTLLYILLGLALGAAYVASPELQASVSKPDELVPRFILGFLPAGLRGLVLAAVLSAAMSSLDSSINSLSAATLRDFIDPDGKRPPAQILRLSKWTTVLWGAAVTVLALFCGNISDTVVEAVNKVGSAFYGPVLAAFVLGVATKRVNSIGVITGVLAGVAFNLVLWVTGAPIHFMWWNAFGFAVTALVGWMASGLAAAPAKEVLARYTLAGAGLYKDLGRQKAFALTLTAYFLVILAVVLGSHALAG